MLRYAYAGNRHTIDDAKTDVKLQQHNANTAISPSESSGQTLQEEAPAIGDSDEENENTLNSPTQCQEQEGQEKLSVLHRFNQCLLSLCSDRNDNPCTHGSPA